MDLIFDYPPVTLKPYRLGFGKVLYYHIYYDKSTITEQALETRIVKLFDNGNTGDDQESRLDEYLTLLNQFYIERQT